VRAHLLLEELVEKVGDLEGLVGGRRLRQQLHREIREGLQPRARVAALDTRAREGLDHLAQAKGQAGGSGPLLEWGEGG
jgi:hypothetical protein